MIYVRLLKYLSGCSETAIILDLGSSVPSSNLGTPTKNLIFFECRDSNSQKGGRGNWVFPRVGNYSKPRVLKERSDEFLIRHPDKKFIFFECRQNEIMEAIV